MRRHCTWCIFARSTGGIFDFYASFFIVRFSAAALDHQVTLGAPVGHITGSICPGEFIDANSDFQLYRLYFLRVSASTWNLTLFRITANWEAAVLANKDQYWRRRWIMTICRKGIPVSTVKMLRAGSTMVLAMSSLLSAETSGTSHIPHSQQAHESASRVGRRSSAPEDEMSSDSVPRDKYIYLFWCSTVSSIRK